MNKKEMVPRAYGLSCDRDKKLMLLNLSSDFHRYFTTCAEKGELPPLKDFNFQGKFFGFENCGVVIKGEQGWGRTISFPLHGGKIFSIISTLAFVANVAECFFIEVENTEHNFHQSVRLIINIEDLLKKDIFKFSALVCSEADFFARKLDCEEFIVSSMQSVYTLLSGDELTYDAFSFEDLEKTFKLSLHDASLRGKKEGVNFWHTLESVNVKDFPTLLALIVGIMQIDRLVAVEMN